MNDARVAYSRRDVSGDRNARQQGGKVRKLASEYTRQSSRYAPYGKQRPTVWRAKERSPAHEVYNADRSGSLAHGTHMRFTGEPSVHHSDDELVHKSSGKRIASQIVTPARHDNDDNVTKRPRVSPRLLTFSPTKKALPVDAQIIGALNGMEIVDPINTEEELHDQEMLAEIQEDDMLGEDLMDMEVGSTSNLQQVERVGDVNARDPRWCVARLQETTHI
ncbi:hypothetical protein HID58_013659 [Brassica napus]|uniref:Uncharacterized protein n=1 Tax=Brassica napus TaxID=3708 RepID=A0ABQ8E4J8_BRANA|nr:hypothetical protein HID58_013659 [Brassica napus]